MNTLQFGFAISLFTNFRFFMYESSRTYEKNPCPSFQNLAGKKGTLRYLIDNALQGGVVKVGNRSFKPAFLMVKLME